MKWNISITISVIAAIIAFVAIAKIPGGDSQEEKSTFEKIMQRDAMTVCYMVWPPSVIKDPNSGNLSGFIVDIANEIASDAGLTLTWVESTWAGFPADLNTGKCDAAIAGIYPTISRSTSVSFTEPFFYAGNGAAVRSQDNRFESIEDLNKKGVKIAVIQGEYGHLYAQKYLPRAELVILEKSSDNTAPLVAVTSRQADVGLIMSDVVFAYTREHPEVQNLFVQPYSTTPIAWAVRHKDQELLNFLDNGIAYLKSSGFLDATAKLYNPSGWFSLRNEYEPLSEEV